MKLLITIPDDVYEVYKNYARNPSDPRSIESSIVSQLKRFSDYAPADRVVVVDSAIRARFEEILPGNPGPSISTVEDLAQRVELLASVEIGEVKVPFSLEQLRYLKNIAERQGRQLEDVVKDTVDRMADLFFDNVRA